MAAAVQPPSLHRRVGLVGAAASGIGIVLGAGIYVLIGEAAGLAGNGIWAAFFVGALLAAGTGLSYAELTSMFPEAGAAAAYAREAFGGRVAFVTGWMDVAVNAIAAPAVALGFGSYFAALFGVDRTTTAVVLLLICAAIVLAGVLHTVRVAALFTVVELAGLLIAIVVGLPYLGAVDLLEVHGGATGLLAAAALVFFAYEGFEEIATLSEEVTEPTVNIPRALLLSLVVTTLIYILVAAVSISVVPWERLAAAEGPLAVVVSEATSPAFQDFISVIALFATFNTVLLVLATGPRAMYGMARRRLLPGIFGSVWRARGTPWFAILVATAISVAFALTGDIGFVAQVTNFAVFTLFVVVNGAVIRLRMTHPEAARPFRMRPALGPAPVSALVGIVGAVVLSAFMERTAFVVGLAALVLGFALSFVLVPRAER